MYQLSSIQHYLKINSGLIIAGLVLFIAAIFLNAYPSQTQFGVIAIGYSTMFLAYFFVLRWQQSDKEWPFFIGVAIAIRLVLIFIFPNLSDDVYRFIWDGKLINAGVNPFNYLPTEIDLLNNPAGLDADLYGHLNSKEFYTVYPPVLQAIFWLATFVFPNSWLGASIVMKFFLVAMDIGVIWQGTKLLQYLKLPKKNILIYALNPLVIIEISGNLHFEGGVIFFFLWGWNFMIKNGSSIWTGILLALSVAVKLIPLIYMPFILGRISWKKSQWVFGTMGVALILLFSPLMNPTFFAHFGDSLELYLGRFEFNGSIANLLKYWSIGYYGDNLSKVFGPLMAMIVFYVIVAKVLLEENQSWFNVAERWLLAISLYLFLSATVHPWYVIYVVIWSVFTRFRYPVIWSALVWLTYINYSYPQYHENYWVIAVEYITVFTVLFLEWRKKLIWAVNV